MKAEIRDQMKAVAAEAVRSLGERERLALRLYLVSGMKVEAIGKSLGVTHSGCFEDARARPRWYSGAHPIRAQRALRISDDELSSMSPLRCEPGRSEHLVRPAGDIGARRGTVADFRGVSEGLKIFREFQFANEERAASLAYGATFANKFAGFSRRGCWGYLIAVASVAGCERSAEASLARPPNVGHLGRAS
jgi:hypothetical protein